MYGLSYQMHAADGMPILVELDTPHLTIYPKINKNPRSNV
jgi:hypothetical protein